MNYKKISLKRLSSIKLSQQGGAVLFMEGMRILRQEQDKIILTEINRRRKTLRLSWLDVATYCGVHVATAKSWAFRHVPKQENLGKLDSLFKNPVLGKKIGIKRGVA